MKSSLAIDFISDLNLDEDQEFDWTDKPTSLFCVIGGGISHSIKKIKTVLEHLSKHYRGVFYIDGAFEHEIISEYQETIENIKEICNNINNVVFLHNHVVVLNGVAFVACNGWFRNNPNIQNIDDVAIVSELKVEDVGYLTNTIRNLQSHKETKKIVAITSSIPAEDFLYHSEHLLNEKIDPAIALVSDQTSKVKNWLFGGSELSVDIKLNNRRYVNNPYVAGQPYWPKRIEI